MYGPNHEKTNGSWIKIEIKKWNNTIKEFNLRQPYRKNKYTGETTF